MYKGIMFCGCVWSFRSWELVLKSLFVWGGPVATLSNMQHVVLLHASITCVILHQCMGSLSGQTPWMAIAPACGTSTCKVSNLTMQDQQNHLPPETNFACQICSDGAVLPTSVSLQWLIGVIDQFGFLPKALAKLPCLSILQGIKYRVSYGFLASLNLCTFKCLVQKNNTC